MSYVTIAATHADYPLVSAEIPGRARKLILQRLSVYCSSHLAVFKWESFEECVICNPDNLPDNLLSAGPFFDDSHPGAVSSNRILHILGYFEVSRITKYPQTLKPTNRSLQLLKSSAAFLYC